MRDWLGQILFGDNTYLTYRAAPQITSGQAFTGIFRFQMPYFATGEYTVAPSIIEGVQVNHVQLHWIEDAIRLRAFTSPIRHGLIGLPTMDIRIEPR